jgi:hypothetical protein
VANLRPMATKAKSGPGKAQNKGRSTGRTTQARTKKTQSTRYTPPVSKGQRSSPRWMGISIIALFLLGVLIVILNYADLLPGGVNNLWLVAAIAAIFGGLIMATRYH